MKKVISMLSILLILSATILSTIAYADEKLESVEVTTDKQVVHPSEEITVSVNFGQGLGAYTVDVAYDSNLLEYVSAEGGIPNDDQTRVRVLFHDETGGSNPSSKMLVKFKAKEGIVTSNPTNFDITANGMASSDASTQYEDITTPITKSIVVEPVYTDYNIALDYTGDIIKNEEKDMKLTIMSSMGKSYEHTRIIAEATTPEGGTVKLLALDSDSLEHDIIQSGWGSADGDSIGGANVSKQLNIRGLFSVAGNYSIILSLVDRESSDNVIASKTFNVEVKDTATPQDTSNNGNTQENSDGQTTEPSGGETTKPSGEEVSENNGDTIDKAQTGTEIASKEPRNMPKTGGTVYVVALSMVAVLILAYAFIKIRK